MILVLILLHHFTLRTYLISFQMKESESIIYSQLLWLELSITTHPFLIHFYYCTISYHFFCTHVVYVHA